MKLLFDPISMKSHIGECCRFNWIDWAVFHAWIDKSNQNCFHFLTRINLVLKHRGTRITLKVSYFSIEQINQNLVVSFFLQVSILTFLRIYCGRNKPYNFSLFKVSLIIVKYTKLSMVLYSFFLYIFLFKQSYVQTEI